MNNTEYEIFSRDVIAQIAKIDGIEILEAVHNVKIEGLTGAKHQIDAHLKVKFLGNETLNVYIEAKNWSRPVDKPTVTSFKGVFDDLPGPKSGVIITCKGFDEGNIKPFCEKSGISLYTLDELTNPTQANFTFEFFQSELHDIKFFYGEINIPEKSASVILDEVLEKPDEKILFYNSNDEVVSNLATLFDEMLQKAKKLADGSYIGVSFPDGSERYFKSDSGSKVRIGRIQGLHRRVKVAEQKECLKLTHLVRVLRNDQKYYVDQDLNVRRANEPMDLKFEFPSPYDEEGIIQANIQVVVKEDY